MSWNFILEREREVKILEENRKVKSQKSKVKNFKNVLVAFSGGADSRFLLNFLIQNKEKFKIKKISCAHVNHNLRGAESDRDEKFVREVCKNLDLEIFVANLDIRKISLEEKKGMEEVARTERYKFFAKICEKENFDCVAVAHNSTDNLETIIFNLARGAKNPFVGMREVQNMKIENQELINEQKIESSKISSLSNLITHNLVIWRPILQFSKQEILEFLEKEKIEFVTDSSNFSLDYSRNKIRHKILPVLREINSAVEKNVLKNSIHFAEKEKNEKEKLKIILSFLRKNSLQCISVEKNIMNRVSAEMKNFEHFNLQEFLKFSDFLQREVLHFLLTQISKTFKIRISTELIVEIQKFLSSKNGKFMLISTKKIENQKIGLYFFKTQTRFNLQEKIL